MLVLIQKVSDHLVICAYTMSTEHSDESDLTFQAAITLDTDDNPVVTITPHRVKRFSVKDTWTGHQTLLLRLAIVVFFILLNTLLETLLPGKPSMIARMLSIDTPDNGTGAGHERRWMDIQEEGETADTLVLRSR
jgi:hypothetical protein